jgi:hypothetical protein
MAKEKSRRKPAFPVVVVMTKDEAEQQGLELMSAKQAAFEVRVSKEMVIYWASRGYIKKYYIFGNTYNYEVDINEVAIQPELGYERLRQVHNTDWASIPRSSNGSRWVKRSEVDDGV